MSNTRRTRPSAAPARSTRPAVEPEGVDFDAAEAQELEAEGGHYVTASLAGDPVRVIPPSAWRLSWTRLLKRDEIDELFERVIHPDDLDLIDEIDPTNDEIVQFLQDAGTLSGEPVGKLSGRRASSRPTRRR
ncbi:hypothetical protein [Kitasatospora phosalacinea]|uniref:Uncharacterized protein n=1 Tax=Kitasatospora phosalacinea TaxID=2065 RepID=A0ABW6GRG0_9ACTN